ncbi:hypothetical protein Plhal703r1_c10g0052031 [Plasmopara halstedii]
MGANTAIWSPNKIDRAFWEWVHVIKSIATEHFRKLDGQIFCRFHAIAKVRDVRFRFKNFYDLLVEGDIVVCRGDMVEYPSSSFLHPSSSTLMNWPQTMENNSSIVSTRCGPVEICNLSLTQGPSQKKLKFTTLLHMEVGNPVSINGILEGEQSTAVPSMAFPSALHLQMRDVRMHLDEIVASSNANANVIAKMGYQLQRRQITVN